MNHRQSGPLAALSLLTFAVAWLPAAARGSLGSSAADGKSVALLPLVWRGVAREELPRPPVGPDRPVAG